MFATLRERAANMALSLLLTSCIVAAQSAKNSGSINGTVVDPTGAVVRRAKVEIRNPVVDLSARQRPIA